MHHRTYFDCQRLVQIDGSSKKLLTMNRLWKSERSKSFDTVSNPLSFVGHICIKH